MQASLTVLAAASFLSVPVLAQPRAVQPPEWVHSLAEAQTRARDASKPILIYCWMDGSDYCTKLFQDTLSAKGAADALGEFVCYSAKHGGAGVQEVFKKYGVTTMPTMLFVTPAGNADDLIQGFIPVDDFVKELTRVKRGEGTVSALEQMLTTSTKGSADNVSARWQLAGKVQALGQHDRHDELMGSIREVDPKGTTLIGARLRMNDIVDDIVGQEGDGHDNETDQEAEARVKAWNLDPLYAHVKTVKLPEAKHEAWMRIGNMQVNRKDMQSAFKAFNAAWKTCPDEKVVDWSNDIARWIIKSAEQRTSKEKKFALALATKALTTLKKQLKEEPPTDDKREMYANYQAYCYNTIAWCNHINGKQKPAIKAAKRAIQLRKTDQYLKDLAKMQE